MADIVQIFTAEQIYNMSRNKLLAANCGLTDFNEGSKIRAILENSADVVSAVSMDFKEGLYKAIPQALYQGFGFNIKEAAAATGFLRFYRKPAFWVTYIGSGTSAQITSSPSVMSATVTGAPGDAFTFAYSTYDTLDLLVAAINALTNWTATIVADAATLTSSLYSYANKEVIGASNYLNATGLDLCKNDATEATVIQGFSVTLDQQIFATTAEGTLEAGDCSVVIAAQCGTTGITGNIAASAIDTLNGLGYLNSTISGIEQAKNDSSFSGGSVVETATERKTRFQSTVNSLNAGTKNGIIAAIKAIDGVRDAGMRTAYPFKGTNTIIVDDGSGTISPELQDSVELVLYGDPNDMENYPGKAAEGIGYNVTAPVIVPVDIGISATRLSNVTVDLTEIKNDIQTAVEQYVNTRGLGENVLLSEVVRVAKNSNNAAYDVIVVSPSSNITIAETEFAKTGSGTGGIVSVTVSIATSA
jgi:uncharacterized phage protein gp47/JayE